MLKNVDSRVPLYVLFEIGDYIIHETYTNIHGVIIGINGEREKIIKWHISKQFMGTPTYFGYTIQMLDGTHFADYCYVFELVDGYKMREESLKELL